MTDHHDPLDELASAHLDGMTTPEESAAVAADASLSQQVERLAATRDLLRSTAPAVDPERRDRAIAAALAAFDEDEAHLGYAVPAAPPATVIDLARRRRTRRTLQLVGAAAAVALVALAIPFVDQLDSGSKGGNDVAAPTNKDMAATEAADAAGGATSTLAPGSPPPELGSFDDLPLLTEAVRDQLDAEGPTVAQAGPAPTRTTSCTEDPALQPVAYVAFAELDGRAVVVVVRDEPDGGRSLVVLDRQSCETVSAGRL